MISFISFFLYATAFSAFVPVKCDSGAFIVLTETMSSINDAITNASNALSGLSAQDQNSIDLFLDSLFNATYVLTTSRVLNATMNQTSLKDMDDTQVQQLSEQSAVYGNNFINFVHSILEKGNDVDNSNITCSLQSAFIEFEVNAAVLFCPIISVSPQPGDAALNMTNVLGNFTLIRSLICDSLG